MKQGGASWARSFLGRVGAVVGKAAVTVVGGRDGGHASESAATAEAATGPGHCVGRNWRGECVGLNRSELLSVRFGERTD